MSKTLNQNRGIFQSMEKSTIAMAMILLLITFFYDDALLRRGVGLRFSALDGLMLYLTDFGLLFFSVLLTGLLLYYKRFRLLVLIIISCAFAFEISYLIKLIFQIPRPYFAVEVATIPLTQASGFSFPSLHTAFCFAVLPFVPRLFSRNWQKYFAYILIILIALSRPYLGVHYFSDILMGAIIGFVTSKTILYYENKYQVTQWFLSHYRDKLELRRQIAHLFVGLLIVFLLRLGLINATGLLYILIIGGLFSLMQRKWQFPFFHKLLSLFEREKDLRTFPGKGSFFMVLGSYLTVLIFPLDTALAAISIMAVGDSVSHLFGRYFGKTVLPFSGPKKLEGTIIAIVVSTLCALFFVDYFKAFSASFIALLVELFLPEKLTKYLDDNLIIPLLAGLIITII
ncbi:MAG: phosphatase PAP2 family protein [Candidatus Altimarinota bacterium]